MTTKQINWSEKSFQANGRTYHIASTMSIGRSVYAEEAKIELETGVRVGRTTETMMEVYNLLNQGKMADASVKAYNYIKAVDSYLERPDPVLRICACYLNYEGEDVRFINDEDVRLKINDWSQEGISKNSFFLFALTLISEETADLQSFTNRTTEAIKKTAAKMMEDMSTSESSAS